MGVKKSKPKKTPYLYDRKIDDSIKRSEKLIQSSNDRIQRARKVSEKTREMMNSIRNKKDD